MFSPSPSLAEPHSVVLPVELEAHGYDIPLTKHEWTVVDHCVQDLSQTASARGKAHALQLLRKGVTSSVIHLNTGLTSAAQHRLLLHLKQNGLNITLHGKVRRGRKPKFPVAKIITLLRKTIDSRPPPGSMRWSLRHLVQAVRVAVPEASTISQETVRGILQEKLHITSVRHLDPYWLKQIRRSHRTAVAFASR